MRRQPLIAGVALVAALFLAGCDRSCEESAVCDTLTEALDDRADDCGAAAITSCPYDPVTTGVGSGVVCDFAWTCIEALEADRVPCDELGGLSLATCAAF